MHATALARGRRMVMLWVTAATPLVFWRGGMDSFEAPKESVLVLAAVACAAFVLPGAPVPAAVLPAAAVFLVLAAASAALSPLPLTAVFGEYTSYQGWLHWVALATVALVAASWLRDRRERRRALAAVAASLAAVAAYAVAQLAGIDPVPWDTGGRVLRSFSTAGNAYFLGTVLAPGVPVALALAVSSPGTAARRWWFAACALILAGVLSSGSRSALAASLAACAPVLLPLLRDPGSRRRLAWPLALALAVPVVAGIAALPADRSPFPLLVRRFGEVLAGGDARPLIWEGASRLIRQRPLVGNGPDTFATLHPAVQSRGLWDRLWHASPEKAHNEPLQMAATVGIPALGVLLWIAAILARTAWLARTDPAARAAGAGLAALGFTALFGFVTRGPEAVAVALAGILLGSLPSRPFPRAAVPPLAALLVLSLLARLHFAASEAALKRSLARNGAGMESALRLRSPWAQNLLRAGDALERSWFGATVGGTRAAADPARVDLLRRIYARARDNNPLHAFAWSDLARLAAREGRWDEADAAYRRARELAPMDAYIVLEQGQALLAAGRREEAVAAFGEAAALYPGFAEPQGLIGYVALSRGRLAEAEPWLRRSLDLDWHGNGQAAYAAAGNLAALYHRQGRESEAAETMARARAFLPPQVP